MSWKLSKHSRSLSPFESLCEAARGGAGRRWQSRAVDRERKERKRREERSKKEEKMRHGLAMKNALACFFQLVLLRAREAFSASFRPRGARSGPQSSSPAGVNGRLSSLARGQRARESRCRRRAEQSEKQAASKRKFHGGKKKAALLPAPPLPLPSPSRPARAARSLLRTRGTCLRVCGEERASERRGSARGEGERREEKKKKI